MSTRTDWLIQTKLSPPPLRGDLVPRPRLTDMLRDGLTSHRLVLLSAPAGYGKTTLLTAALRPPFPVPVAWLTLDKWDNDPALLLAYLVAAFRRLLPQCRCAAQTLLDDLPNPADRAHQIIAVLVNEVLEHAPGPLALVLDDVHHLTEPLACSLLDYLVERLPPPLHLVIATRHDPPLSLARLRAQGQLLELRLADLRFTRDEAAAFLNDHLHLSLSPADLTRLHTRTEGWAAGLRLLACSLERIPAADHPAFIADLTRTDRYVFDFLAEQVLARQSEPVRTFLLETSILPELTVPLCAAVTGRDDVQAILEDLDRRNLFAVAVDERRTVFRYHALFAEFLRWRLGREMPERVRELHRRAAQAQTQPDRVIAHYLAAEMWPEAARVIAQVGETWLHHGLLDVVSGWLDALPETVRASSPTLLYLAGACASQRGAVGDARPLLEQARRGFAACGDETGQGKSLAMLAECAIVEADVTQGQAAIARALTFPLPPAVRVQLLMGRAWLELVWGDRRQAAADLTEASRTARMSGDPDALRTLIEYLSPAFAALPGGLDEMERLCRRAETYWGDTSAPTPVQVLLKGVLAFIHLWRGRLDQAIRAGREARAVSEQLGGIPALDADLAAPIAVAHTLRGDHATADAFFAMTFERGPQFALEDAFRGGWLYLRGRAYLAQGRRDAAYRTYTEMEAAADGLELPFVPLLRLMMRGVLELTGPPGRRRLDEAERWLRQAIEKAGQTRFTTLFGSPRLLLARCYQEQGLTRAALRELAPVLAESERRRTPGRILVESPVVIPLLRLAVERGVQAAFASRLLRLLEEAARPRPLRVPDTGATLTRREVEVLRLVAQGLSNRAIAARLTISEHTVKSHLVHILRKLDVSSRTQAAARARRLGLIPEP